MKIIEGQDYRGTKILYYFRGCGNCRSTFSVCQTLDKSRQIESRQSQQELLYQCRRCKKIGIGRTDRAERQRAC